MYGLVQVYIMIFFIFLYLVIAAVPVVIVMITITHLSEDKAFFRRRIDNYARKQGWRI